MNTPKATRIRKQRILVVDDHPLMRDGLRRIINQQADLVVCGEAGNADEALLAVKKLKPDLIVMDLSMPGRDGLELVRQIRIRNPHSVVLVLSMHEESLYGERVLRAGASGYVMKSASLQAVIEAIRRVGAGQLVLGPQVLGQIMAQTAAGFRPGAAAPAKQLTDRELEIYRLLGQGRQRAEIAAQLGLSPKTVETHRLNMRQKLGIRSATELRRQAMEFLREEAAGLHPG